MGDPAISDNDGYGRLDEAGEGNDRRFEVGYKKPPVANFTRPSGKARTLRPRCAGWHGGLVDSEGLF